MGGLEVFRPVGHRVVGGIALFKEDYVPKEPQEKHDKALVDRLH